jgi:hypothetical protein
MALNVFPANQGFPRPPDGGVIVPTAVDIRSVSKQAFKPAPLVNPFPIEPTAPATPFLPASQGVAPIPSQSVVVPPALDVNLMGLVTEASPTQPVPTYVVSDAGSFNVNPGSAVKYYTIVSVVDNESGAPASPSSVNLRITIAGGAPLGSYGFTFAGRTLYFVTGAWIVPPQPSTPERQISVWGDVTGGSIIIVPNQDADGTSLVNPLPPVAGNTVALETARLESEVVFQQTGIVQDVVPSTTPHFPGEQVAGVFTVGPLIPEPGDVETLVAVQEVDVSDQETVVGTPANYFPGIKL